jgi:hypothetical protein
MIYVFRPSTRVAKHSVFANPTVERPVLELILYTL